MKLVLSAQKLHNLLSKTAGKTIYDNQLIEDGDKILVAVSGGKDSLSLLKILEHRRRFIPIKYDLVAVHVDMHLTRAGLKRLVDFFKKNAVSYKIVKLKIKKSREKNCFWCAWNRRKVLFEQAVKLGCNKIALGHHLDDIAETILMNMFFNGEISSMLPKQSLFKGELTVIRPFAEISEYRIKKFADLAGLKYSSCKCAYADKNKRELMQKFIKRISKTCPEVRINILRSLKRIKRDYLPT